MHFDQLVLAGGGNRCWWQAGFWHVLNEYQPQRLIRVSAISAGAATACLLYARPGQDGAQWGLNYYAHALANIKKNAYWGNLFSRTPIFPHYQLYKSALRNMLADSFERLKSAPDIQVGLARAPNHFGPRMAVCLGLLAYNLEKYSQNSLHPKLGKGLGFERVFVRAQDCANLDDLIDLILQSSCTPPFTPVMFRDQRPILDGGLVDNVPTDGVLTGEIGLPSQRILVLLTRKYPFPQYFSQKQPGLDFHYFQPSRPVASASWDYTHPEHMVLTYQQGREDAKQMIEAGFLGNLA
jgi:hypothetical protein